MAAIRFRWALVPVLGLALGASAGTNAARLDEQEAARDRRIEVRRLAGGAWLGVSLDEVGKDDVSRLKLPQERGALVVGVEKDSPAEQAGLAKDDVIVGYQGDTIQTAAQLARLVRETPPGREVSLEISRAGQTQRLEVTLAERERGGFDWSFEMPELPALPEPPDPPEPPAAPPAPRVWRGLGDGFLFRSAGPRKLGIRYQELGEQLARYFQLSADEGVLVSHVEQDSPAAKGGMQAGDVILDLGGSAVRDGDDLRRALDRADPGSEVAVKVQRAGKPLELKVTLGGQAERRERRRVTEL